MTAANERQVAFALCRAALEDMFDGVTPSDLSRTRALYMVEAALLQLLQRDPGRLRELRRRPAGD